MSKLVNNAINNEVLQAALSLIIWTTICILYIMERTVPDSLLIAGSAVLGFYFHNTAQKSQIRNEARYVKS